MFKKILSSLTIMLLAFSMNAGAQSFQALKTGAGKLMPKYAAKNVVTSKIDLKGDEYWGGYWNGAIDNNLSLVGVQQVPVTYDAGICYPAGSASINGMTMEGLKFSFPDCTNIQDVKIWMSTHLPKLPEEADIVCQEVTELTDIENGDDPFIEVRFDKPYKADPTKDLYIGYTFTVASGSGQSENFPVLIYMGEDKPNALWLKFGGEQGEWMDYNGYDFGVLAVQVLMSGTFPENAVTLHGDLGSMTSTLNSEVVVPITAESAGSNGIQSMDLSVSVNGEAAQVQVKPEEPILGIGAKFNFQLKIQSPEQTGLYDLVVTVDKINGEANPIDAVASGTFYIVSKTVQKKPFVEEFTGMWCGYCPRGIIGMEKLRMTYADDVVLVAVHAGDALDCSVDYSSILGTIAGYPSAHVDREYMDVDPYYGLTGDFGIAEIVDACAANIPVAGVNAYADIEGDILTAKSEIEFLYSGAASDFGVAYLLTEDGMQDDKWSQSNYYSGATGQGLEDAEPLFEPWVNGDPDVKGVIYNDVAIAALGIETGVEGSVPAEVVDGEKNIHSVEFDLSKYTVIQDRQKLSLAVILLNKKTGKVVNANFVRLSETATDIACVESNERIEETARYTVDGRRINVPQKGVNIVKYNDGSVKKIIVK